MSETVGESSPLTQALAEMLYERAQQWRATEWLSWPHVDGDIRAYWLRIAAEDGPRILASLPGDRADSSPEWTYEAIAARATVDSAFRDGLRAASAVCRAQGTNIPCPSSIAAVYIDRLANGQEP